MVFIYFVLYGLLGAVTGSFLNVCILRIPANQNFVTGRSHCPACGHVLAFYDMVPVLSWLFLKGRCRYCRAPVSIQYPAVELLTASAFLLCLLAKGPGMESALMCMFSSILITAAFIDARHMYIPDGIHILILLLSCISLAAGSGPAIINRLGGSLLFEVGIGQAPAVETILASHGYEDIQTYQDTAGIWRVVQGTANN